jgi:hypothetical protein
MLSCSREQEDVIDTPSWLKDRIAADEKEIAANPQSGLVFTAWLSYRFNNTVCYEHINLISSARPRVFRYDGSEINSQETEYEEYQKGKCCKAYVWRGKSYFEP